MLRIISTWYYIVSSGKRVIMGFGDLQTDDGLQALNEYLADKSYIEG